MEGNLSLDWKSGWELGGDRGPAIVPNQPDRSLIIQAIRHTQAELRMPEEKLADNEIEILSQWIERGAYDDRVTEGNSALGISLDWWSLRPLVRPNVPGIETKNPIDAFVRERLVEVGIGPSKRADRRTLIRRVYYDVTGLPPSYQEVEAFCMDPTDTAYDSLVDRLLESERYGERWARHWLDTIHFADSHGYEHDIGREHAWRYRDYVIQALNQDKPWALFIREQLAADHFFPEAPSLMPALGFLGAGTFDLSTYSTATVSFEYPDRDDLVTQTMAAFTSTTANCARCHTHKFDPISQEDYYALQAVFAGLIKGDVAFDLKPETARERHRLQSLLDAVDRKDVSVLMLPEHQRTVEQWLSERQPGTAWQSLSVETYLSTEGATLSQTPEGVLLASGNRPERDTYLVTADIPIERVTALRLEVLSHDSLPWKGPGRADNGNLHLSEIEIQYFEPGSEKGRPLAIRRSSADFNQVDWGIERCIDGDPKTAWGIYPAVGISHHAVFELTEPIVATPGAKLAISLRQLHGGSHLIGAFRLSITSSDSMQTKAIPIAVENATQIPSSDRSQEDRLTLAAYVLRESATQAIQQLPPKVFVYAAGRSVGIPAGEGQVQLKSLPTPKVVHVLHRGDFDKPRAVAMPGSLSLFDSLPSRFLLREPNNEAERRAALADWIAHRDNVLTWRSAVNRVWHYHFGRGLCDTPSDLGRMGGIPTHPELIDWLALWFRDEAKGSLKALHRLILTSDTYCQSVRQDEAAIKLDGENRFLWRQNRHRLDADAIRDFTLAASGSLDLSMGGPGIQHFKQSKGPQLTPALDYSGYDWGNPGASRRSIYRTVWRGIADPFMEALDFPDLGLLSPSRGYSASSLQALALYNNDFILYHSEKMANESATHFRELDRQVSECAKQVWLRSLHEDEHSRLTQFAKQHGLAELCRVLLNSNEFLFVE